MMRMVTVKALAAVMVLAMSALQVSGPVAADDRAFQVGVDRPGHDIDDFDVDAGAKACQLACQDHERCQAWTFVGPEAPQGAGHCWLKDAIPDPRPMENAVSGVVGMRLPVAGWGAPRAVRADAEQADLVVRVGDIDNLGFGWPPELDPFTGKSTPSHSYPWSPEDDDPAGTDRIMLGSGYDGNPPKGQDGYTGATSRPVNRPEAVTLKLPEERPEIERALLQLFVDDFQAPLWGGHYRVELDGRRIPGMETAINALEQTGPIGKLISLPLLAQYHELLADGELEVAIDDPTTGAGDGYAIDFVRLLINPRNLPHTVRLVGRVTQAKDGTPITGALVSSALAETETGAEGRYRLEGVPAGLAVVTAAKEGFAEQAKTADLLAGQQARVTFALKRAQSDAASLATELERKGRARLSGIYFDLDSARVKDASRQTLQSVIEVMREHPGHGYRIEGHTDSQGDPAYNQRLSRERAQAVVEWLVSHGIERARLTAEGYGEQRPVADNTTAAGRALNRRVEIARR